MDNNIDINKVIDTLMHEIGEQAKQIALLKVQLVASQPEEAVDQDIKEEDD